MTGNDLSETLANAVQGCSQSVVRVEGGGFRSPSTGIVWSADGLVVTANHSLERDEPVEVGLADGQTVSAVLVGRDPTTDLAVVRVSASGLSPANFTERTSLRVGNLLLAVGRPGRSARATFGVLSALGDAWRTSAGGRIDRYLQTDFALPPGFSGGPLVDLSGQVLGLNTARLIPRCTVAIPTSTVRRVVGQLLAEGKVKRGFLGIGTFPVALPARLQKQLNQSGGLLVIAIQPDGPADKAGITLGDGLLSLNGHSLQSVDDLIAQLDAESVGTEITLRLLRANQVLDQRITVTSRS